MSRGQISSRYSRALLSRVDVAEVPGVIEELKAFSKLIESNRQLKLLFAGQIFTENEKDRAVTALFPHLKLSPATESFLKLIILKGHLSAINEIISSSTDIYNEKKKKATAVITSAIAMDTSYTDRLRKALGELTGREIEIKTKVDPSLLGGFIVKVGSTIYDSSIQGQLRLLRTELTR